MLLMIFIDIELCFPTQHRMLMLLTSFNISSEQRQISEAS